jgi:hypothetical protein
VPKRVHKNKYPKNGEAVMLISNSKKFIFIHIPKSGGTSVTQLLDKELEWNDIVLGGTESGEAFKKIWSPRFGIRKHSLPSEIKSVIGGELYSSYLKFIVVREPVERVKSAFSFIRTLVETNAQWFLDSGELKKMDDLETFEGFLNSKYFLKTLNVIPENARQIQRWFMPQSIYFDRSEFERGRFLSFRLNELIRSTEQLRAAGITKESHALTKANSSNWHEMVIDNSIIFKLQNLYLEDYVNFNF